LIIFYFYIEQFLDEKPLMEMVLVFNMCSLHYLNLSIKVIMGQY